MNSSMSYVSSKFLAFIVVLCSLSILIVSCEYQTQKDLLQSKIKQHGPMMGLASSERLEDYGNEVLESDESNSNENLSKLKLLELLFNELNRKEGLNKRGYLRSVGKDDRRRPGWELAYGRRKRNAF